MGSTKAPSCGADANIERLAAKPRGVDTHHDGQDKNERQGDDVQQQGDRQSVADQLGNGAIFGKAHSKVWRFEAEPSRLAVSVLAEPDEGHVVEPTQILNGHRLVKTETLVDVRLHRRAFFRAHVTGAGQQACANTTRSGRHNREHQHGDARERGQHQQDAAYDVVDHASVALLDVALVSRRYVPLHRHAPKTARIDTGANHFHVLNPLVDKHQRLLSEQVGIGLLTPDDAMGLAP